MVSTAIVVNPGFMQGAERVADILDDLVEPASNQHGLNLLRRAAMDWA